MPRHAHISFLVYLFLTTSSLAFLLPSPPPSLPSPSALLAGPQQADGAIRVKNIPSKVRPSSPTHPPSFPTPRERLQQKENSFLLHPPTHLPLPIQQKEWVPLLKAAEIAPGDLIPVDSNGLTLLLAADYDGTVYCTAGCSPFMSAPLSDGKIQNSCIVCPQSGSSFDLQTGELVGEWCPFPPLLGPLIGKLYEARDLAVFPVRAKGANIEAFIDVNTKAQFESKYW